MAIKNWEKIGVDNPRNISRWYNKKTNQQLTLQPTVGGARRYGRHELVLFKLNEGIGGHIISRGFKRKYVREVAREFIKKY